jgi:hypothetical protein
VGVNVSVGSRVAAGVAVSVDGGVGVGVKVRVDVGVELAVGVLLAVGRCAGVSEAAAAWTWMVSVAMTSGEDALSQPTISRHKPRSNRAQRALELSFLHRAVP